MSQKYIKFYSNILIIITFTDVMKIFVLKVGKAGPYLSCDSATTTATAAATLAIDTTTNTIKSSRSTRGTATGTWLWAGSYIS